MEQIIVSAAQPQDVKPIQLPEPVEDSSGSMIKANNSSAERLAGNNAARVQFQEKAAHDMKSLLATILGYADLIAESGSQTNQPDTGKFGTMIVQQALRLERMIDDAFSATRILEGRFEIVQEPINLGPLLSSLVGETSEQSGREISFQDKLGRSLIRGDALRLREAFHKILDNALKYSAADTPVQVTIDQDETKNRIEIHVEDHGVGIAETELAKLFLPFSRIRNEQTKAIPGNGLSLYIVKAIIEGHRGNIDVRSHPGQGTIIVTSLPLEGVEG